MARTYAVVVGLRAIPAPAAALAGGPARVPGGLYCYWRTGAGVVAQNALRYLEVK
jgi:hypothetical protein